MPADLSSREPCEAGYKSNTNRVRRAFHTPNEPGGGGNTEVNEEPVETEEVHV